MAMRPMRGRPRSRTTPNTIPPPNARAPGALDLVAALGAADGAAADLEVGQAVALDGVGGELAAVLVGDRRAAALTIGGGDTDAGDVARERPRERLGVLVLVGGGEVVDDVAHLAGAHRAGARTRPAAREARRERDGQRGEGRAADGGDRDPPRPAAGALDLDERRAAVVLRRPPGPRQPAAARGGGLADRRLGRAVAVAAPVDRPAGGRLVAGGRGGRAAGDAALGLGDVLAAGGGQRGAAEVARRRVAVGRVLGERAGEHAVEGGRDARRVRRARRRCRGDGRAASPGRSCAGTARRR